MAKKKKPTQPIYKVKSIKAKRKAFKMPKLGRISAKKIKV